MPFSRGCFVLNNAFIIIVVFLFLRLKSFVNGEKTIFVPSSNCHGTIYQWLFMQYTLIFKCFIIKTDKNGWIEAMKCVFSVRSLCASEYCTFSTMRNESTSFYLTVIAMRTTMHERKKKHTLRQNGKEKSEYRERKTITICIYELMCAMHAYAMPFMNKVLMIVIIYLLRALWEDLSTRSPVSMRLRRARSHEPRNERRFFVDVH